MRFLIQLLCMVAVALVVGFGLSYYALTDGRLFGALKVGPWAAWPAVGSPSPDPYTRAYLARTGALQLGQGEGLQFVATNDSDGHPLDRSAATASTAPRPVATFWTLRAGRRRRQQHRPPGWAGRASRSRDIARANDGSLVLYVSKTLAPHNWLEITGNGPFRLVLTLYDPSNLSGERRSGAVLPAILREACGA